MVAHWKITKLLWTSDGHWALAQMAFVKWPVQSHVSIVLRGEDLSEVPKYVLEQYNKWRDKGKINLKIESKICTRLNLPHDAVETFEAGAKRYVFAWFPVLTDTNQYEVALEEISPPQFLSTYCDNAKVYTIKKICGIWRDKKAVPKVMIDWCAKMQGDKQVRKGVKRKFKELVPWEKVQHRDVKLLAELREPRMNRQGKRFMMSMIHSVIDNATARLAPWVKPYVLRTMTQPQKHAIIEKLQSNISHALNMEFINMWNIVLFQKWFGHVPTTDFAQAIDFRQQLGVHLHGESDYGENEFIQAIKVYTNNYVTDEEIGNLVQTSKTVYALRVDVENYKKVMGILKGAKIVVGEIAQPKGTCVVAHPDDATHWRNVADVDEVVLLHELASANLDTVTIFRAHLWSLDEWALFADLYGDVKHTLYVSGRLDQYAHGRGQVFRDAATRLFKHEVAPTPVTSTVVPCETLEEDVQQRFVATVADKEKVHVVEHKRIWMYNPKRVRTLNAKPRGIGHIMFKEHGEKPCTIPHIKDDRWADVVTLREWRGPMLDAAALYITPKTTAFDIYCARTFTKRLLLVGTNAVMPSDSGVIPARRSLRACLENDGI